jgi:uncharacterized phage infection (PIP) family protein YhgE
MENEKFQEIVINHLAHLTQEITELKGGQAKLESGQAKLESGQAKLESGQVKLESGQAKLEAGQVRLNERMERIEQSQTQLTERMDRVEQSLARIENEHGAKINALFDAREAQFDVNARMNATLNRIEEKLDRLMICAPLKQIR